MSLFLKSARVGRRPLLSPAGRGLVWLLGLTALLAVLVQLVMGAPLVVLMLALIAVVAGLYGFAVLGAYNLASWVAMFYALGNVLVALYAKTSLGQTLDSELYAATASFAALAVTSGALLAALLVVRHVPVGRPVLDKVSDCRFLSFLSWSCFVLGMVFWVLNRGFQDPDGSGFGGITLFRDLLFMAVIARTAMVLERSRYERTFDAWLGFLLAVSVFSGLVDNSKALAALPVVSYFATVLFYTQTLPKKAIVILGVGSVVFATVVAPMVHAMRAMGQQEMSLNDRVEFVFANTARLLEGAQEVDQFKYLAASQFQDGYYNYFGDNGAGQMVLGRYASVQQIDPVIAEVARQGTIGGTAVWPGLTRLVPSFVLPDKPQYIEAYNTLVYYGLVDPVGGKSPTLPLAGQAYAAYGAMGLATIPFVTFVGFLLCVKKLGWDLHRNVFAIFVFCDFVVVYVSQGEFGQFAGAALRNLPLFAIVFLLLAQVYRWRAPMDRVAVEFGSTQADRNSQLRAMTR